MIEPTREFNGWAFITATYDGPSRVMTYYGNGVKPGSRTTINIPPPETTTFALLTPAKVASHGITGSPDDVRVFNAALTDAQVLALYH